VTGDGHRVRLRHRHGHHLVGLADADGHRRAGTVARSVARAVTGTETVTRTVTVTGRPRGVRRDAVAAQEAVRGDSSLQVFRAVQAAFGRGLRRTGPAEREHGQPDDDERLRKFDIV